MIAKITVSTNEKPRGVIALDPDSPNGRGGRFSPTQNLIIYFSMEKEILLDETRRKLKDLSKAFLRLHKTLLDGAKTEYEAENGRITSVNHYFQLVLDDAHFAWLRKMSSLIALIDEAVSVRRPASETEARALFVEAKMLLNFEDADADFNDRFQRALQKNPDAVLSYNDALKFTTEK
ncbi:MAG TPA: hypothetical protein VK400_16530 [Pyrinomonadaceae bacterium]|nr:hypothetical protein [Pyrinomonadaceae bacterium]